MQLDPKNKEVKEWLTIAKQDLKAGQVLALDAECTAQATFFAQQVVEKALKAVLVWHQERFQKEHDIRYLGDLVLQKEESLKELIHEAVCLNPYAVTIRYPGYFMNPTFGEVKQALGIAERLFQAVLLKVPKDCHP